MLGLSKSGDAVVALPLGLMGVWFGLLAAPPAGPLTASTSAANFSLGVVDIFDMLS